MSRLNELNRRTLLATLAAAGPAAALSSRERGAEPAVDDPTWKISRGRINQSVVQWCFKPMPIEDLARHAAALGMKSVELAPPSDWPVLKKHGLSCAIASSHGFVKGWNLHKLHEDRYFVLHGTLELVLYDVRPESATCGKLSRIWSRNRDGTARPALSWRIAFVPAGTATEGAAAVWEAVIAGDDPGGGHHGGRTIDKSRCQALSTFLLRNAAPLHKVSTGSPSPRAISMRCTSEVPSPISSTLASR